MLKVKNITTIKLFSLIRYIPKLAAINKVGDSCMDCNLKSELSYSLGLFQEIWRLQVLS